jgi:hypothetical protein
LPILSHLFTANHQLPTPEVSLAIIEFIFREAVALKAGNSLVLSSDRDDLFELPAFQT